MSTLTPEQLAAQITGERITNAHVRTVALPAKAGTMALITLDNGEDHTKPSTLGPHSLLALRTALDQVEQMAAEGSITSVGITGKPFIFLAGADLSQVHLIRSADTAAAMAQLGHDQLRRLGEMSVPSFAFINGLCLGGGLEVALHCTYRTISSGVPALALPETFLGLVPGWGGTYLLPRLIGPEKALKVIVENPLNTNRMLKGPQAFELGIADAMFAPADFLERSIAWAAAVVNGEIVVGRDRSHLDNQEAWDAAVATMGGQVALRVGKSAPAFAQALALVTGARTWDRDTGFAAEDRALTELMMSDQFRAGVYSLDLTQKRAKRPTGAPDKALAQPVTKVGVVGAGLMARQLALLFMRKMTVPVVICDLDQRRVDEAVAWLGQEIDTLQAKRRLRPDTAARLKAGIHGTVEHADFADCDLVIEAVFEELSVKKAVFASLEKHVSPQCILATNTSSLSVTEMGADLVHPERLVGLHFFNPVSVMPLIEVIRSAHSSDTAYATGFSVVKSLGKTAVGVADSPSFVVNRILGRLMAEVGRIVEAGTPVDIVDRAFIGLTPMPPFVLLGLVGPTIALHNARTLNEAFGEERFPVSQNLSRMVEAGKNSFYVWNGPVPSVDPEVAPLLVTPQNPVVLDAAQIQAQVLAALTDEARRILDENVVSEPQDLDLAMITGAGFPFWNGGLTPLLDRTGVAEQVTGRRFLPEGVASVAF